MEPSVPVPYLSTIVHTVGMFDNLRAPVASKNDDVTLIFVEAVSSAQSCAALVLLVVAVAVVQMLFDCETMSMRMTMKNTARMFVLTRILWCSTITTVSSFQAGTSPTTTATSVPVFSSFWSCGKEGIRRRRRCRPVLQQPCSAFAAPAQHARRSTNGPTAVVHHHYMKTGNDDEKKMGLPFALPSINQVLLTWLVFLSGSRLLESLSNVFVSVSADSNNKIIENPIHAAFLINGLFFVGAVLGLVKSLKKFLGETVGRMGDGRHCPDALCNA